MNRVDIREGVSIVYEDDWFGPPWEEKENVVLIHGIAESTEAWTRWVPALAGRFRVLRLDLPGFGRSTAPQGYDWEPHTLADDVARFLDRLGLTRVHVVAAKYGGSVALSFATRFPARVLTLSVFGAPARSPVVHRENGVATEDAVLADRNEWVERTMRRRLGSAVSEAQVAWWKRLMRAADLRAFVGATTACGHLDLEHDLHRITAPCLVATTEGSALQSVASAREYQEKIRNSRLLVLPGDGYHVAASAPLECARHVLEFIDAQRTK